MKNLKKVLSALLAVMMIASMAACGSSNTPSETEAGSAENGSYTINVETVGGMPMAELQVYIYEDDTLSDLKQYGQTDEKGSVTLEMTKSDTYAVQLAGVPEGYSVEASYPFTGNTCNIKLKSQVRTDESLSNVTLGVGDVMVDFTVETPYGETVTLSELLKEKELVLLNFWYDGCSWCDKEFPYMQEAYDLYSDSVGIVAVSPMDEDPAVQAYQEARGLTFPMAKCQSAWANTFGVSGYPTTVFIDRYGVICLIEAGGITSLRPFVSAFDHFTGDGYEQTLFTALGEMVTDVKPTYTMDTPENVAALMNNGEIPVTYHAEEDEDSAEFSWPFIEAEKLGEKCLKASNQGIESSFAILYADVELKAGQAVGFDYLVSSEQACDIMYVIVDGEDIYAISGVFETEEWKACYPWVAEADGTYEVALCYLKDESDNAGDDTVYIKNMRIVEEAEIDVASYIPRYAASTEDGFDYTYAEVVLNEEDGYYHVGTADGPLLLADLMNYTQFNEERTIWEMVYDGDITVDGHNYYDELVGYCNFASNSSLNGICTVNEELGELLKIVASVAGFDGGENEWLKICKYFQTYGTEGQQLQDPIAGLAPFSAFEATYGTNVESNYFYYDRAILPRGLLAEFVPDRSGVYRITSRCDYQDGLDAWIFDKDRNELYVYEQAERMFEDSQNVSMVYYMEAGEPYYLDIAFWDVYAVGYIYYDIEYIGYDYELFRLAAPGYFTYDTNATGDAMYHLIAGGIDVVLNEEDGLYYEDLGLDEDGNQRYGSKLYADFTGLTPIFDTPISTVQTTNSNGEDIEILGMIDKGGFDFSKTEEDLYVLGYLNKYDGDVEATDAYLHELWGDTYDEYAEIYQVEDVYEGIYHGEGEDLTEEISAYLDDIITSGGEEKLGCVVVDQRLAEILQMVMDKYTFQNVENSWTKLCYYYQYLGPEG